MMRENLGSEIGINCRQGLIRSKRVEVGNVIEEEQGSCESRKVEGEGEKKKIGTL